MWFIHIDSELDIWSINQYLPKARNVHRTLDEGLKFNSSSFIYYVTEQLPDWCWSFLLDPRYQSTAVDTGRAVQLRAELKKTHLN